MSEPHKRLHTLLTDRAIAGLDETQQAELRHLLAGATMDLSYEAAAAAIELSLMAHAQAMPAAVKAGVIEQASHYWGFMVPRQHQQTIGAPAREDSGALLLDDGGESAELLDSQEDVLESSLTNGRIDAAAKPGDSQSPGVAPESDADFELASHEDLAPQGASPDRADPVDGADAVDGAARGSGSSSRAAGETAAGASLSDFVRLPVSESRLARVATYISAIAALVMLSIALWLFAHRGDPPDPDDLRSQAEGASDKLEWTFVAKQDPAVREGAGGSVLWSSEAQAGVLTLHGLEPTGSGDTQYQLWIVDNKRDGPPVDGGVFDVQEGEGEVEIPIDAKLVIGEPSAFVITVERPGGVVVSAQARVVMVATGS